MQETLAHDWRKRMVARSSICAMLFAIPVLAAVLIGFSSGLGGLPFGINSLASGPSQDSVDVASQAAGDSAALAASASTATARTPADSGAGGTGGGGTGGGAGGGGTGGGGTGGGTATGPTTGTLPGGDPPLNLGGGGSPSGGGNAGNPGLQLPGGAGDIVDDAASGAGQALGGLGLGGGN
ncbi:MAG: hypothetical protein AABM29_00385 [Actinomycetota bacterium]